MLTALVLAAIYGILLGIPTLKLGPDYLAMVTLAAAEIIRIVGRSTSLTWLTGGSAGIAPQNFTEKFENASPLPNGSTKFLLWTYNNNIANSWWLRIVAWVLVAIALLLCWRWFHSPWGRVLKGIREDENAIRSLGKSVTKYKMQALILGGLFGAIAGIVFILPRSLNPDSLGRTVTFYTWTILLLGGAATIMGPVRAVGAAHRREGDDACDDSDHRGLLEPDRGPRLGDRGRGAHAARDLPPARHSRQQEGAGVQWLTQPTRQARPRPPARRPP